MAWMDSFFLAGSVLPGRPSPEVQRKRSAVKAEPTSLVISYSVFPDLCACLLPALLKARPALRFLGATRYHWGSLPRRESDLDWLPGSFHCLQRPGRLRGSLQPLLTVACPARQQPLDRLARLHWRLMRYCPASCPPSQAASSHGHS